MAILSTRIIELPDGEIESTSAYITADAVSGSVETQYHLGSEVAAKLLNDFTYTYSGLETTSKVPVGAINELASTLGILLPGILIAGQTTVTISNNYITTASLIDYYGDTAPENIVATTGSVTLTFAVQSQDLSFLVGVM